MSNTPLMAQLPLHLDLAQAAARVGGEDALRTMLAMLREMLERDGPLIENALAHGDAPTASKLLHSLKGCMPLFCFSPLCDQVAGLEQLSKTAAADTLQAPYAALKVELQQLNSEIGRYLAG